MNNFYKIPRDVFLSMSLMTRIPMSLADEAYVRQSRATWAFPIVGCVVGGLVWGMLSLAHIFVSLPAATVIAVAFGTFLTGAMHEDGLADCLDGFWGGYTIERRLEIMKDSQIGTYGVAGLALILLLKVILLTEAQANFWVIVTAAVASRAGLPMIMATIPNARKSGLAHSVGIPTVMTGATSIALGAILVLFLQGLSGITVIFITFAVLFLITKLALAKIGGQTGDVLGASQVISEIAILLALSAQ